ncbi:hypothetical protein [Streptomyces sp. NPDC057694]|uniref:hypothetical protein n=1 Tax=Streptomyces sp. NPDC057694 TaxID=3346216 RepID=UPI0036C0EE10
MSYTEHHAFFSAPAVPVGTVGDGPLVAHGAYTEQITRKLSAAAFVRRDWVAVLQDEVKKAWKLLKAKVRHWLRWLLPPPAAPTEESGPPAAPTVVLGDDYAVWVRQRIKKEKRPLPVYAFDQAPVLSATDRALGRRRRRIGGIVAVSGVAAVAVGLGAIEPLWVLVAALAGVWALFLGDRVVAQQELNAVLAGVLSGVPVRPAAPALPYAHDRVRDLDSTRDRFVGAGLQAWPEAVIGIDVEPAPEGQDEEEDPAAGFSAGAEDELAEMQEVARAVLDALQRQNRPVARKRLKRFEAVDLHRHVEQRLSNPAPQHHRDHPQPRMQVAGIAGIHISRWDTIDEETWDQLQKLASSSTVKPPPEEVARRYIWSRVTAWNGELVVAILVHVAYQGGFLRVTVRPHVMTPLNPAVGSLVAAQVAKPRWLVRASLNAVGDILDGLHRLVRRQRRPRPELDPGKGPVSLREVYSVRSIEDMHMHDDARYYVQMMQRRVFDSTEIFLRDHNVDIASYREQSAAIYNFGVMNGGTMSGPVQAAPFSHSPSMNNAPAGARPSA